jgi:hypothetical protein
VPDTWVSASDSLTTSDGAVGLVASRRSEISCPMFTAAPTATAVFVPVAPAVASALASSEVVRDAAPAPVEAVSQRSVKVGLPVGAVTVVPVAVPKTPSRMSFAPGVIVGAAMFVLEALACPLDAEIGLELSTP